MATIVEFVILATGWKYQQMVCVPQGMGVTFFGIGPIGATILAVELLKLPLACWTASRIGWQKGFMLVVGLPLICLLTFQLVKDMAVYEMGMAMKPASEILEKATVEEVKMTQLNVELANQQKDENAVKASIAEKKADRDRKIAELAAKQAKAKAELDESIKHNEATRQDAIRLTDFQKKELADVEARQASLIKQFDADSAQLTKATTELRARRETELSRAATWNTEEARIENAYKTRMAEYTNKKTAYEKDKAEYDSANVLRRQLMKEPVDPGVPPERESNKVLKPTLVAELESQIKAKESELVVVNNKRRDSVAQVGTDARRLREEFAKRSGSKREESDLKREELLASLAQITKESAAEAKQIDREYEASVLKEQDALKCRRPLEVIRAELDASRTKAEVLYDARETAIKNTQVHRIATTVEIVRGLLHGERPTSIKATAKERGDIYTDQISMVRVWVYPVFAFIVAFLPTLMVEIGFSTIFRPEKQQRPYRLGFFGRGLHLLYTRAGRLKMLRTERMAREATGKLAARDREISAAKTDAAKALAGKEAELEIVRAAMASAAVEHEEKLKQKEEEWGVKHAGLVESLNGAIAENDALRDLQKSEVERQIQLRQNAWSERLAQVNNEFDDLRIASEAERTAMLQDHHNKLLAVAEDCKTQVIEARRQLAEGKLAAKESTAKLTQDLKEARQACEMAETRLKHQADSFALQLSHVKEQTAREVESAVDLERQRSERQQADLEKALRHRDEDFEHRWRKHEQELSFSFETRMAEEKTKAEQEARLREADIERQLEARGREVDARSNQELQRQEETFQVRLKQQEVQLQAQAEARLREVQTQAEEQLRRRKSEFERQLDAQSREAEAGMREELQQKELSFHAMLKQREQELINRAAARESELQDQRAADLRAIEEESEQQAESRVRATATRLAQEAQQKEEDFQLKLRQREQQLQSQFDARQAELKAQWNQDLLDREGAWESDAEARARATESRQAEELRQKEELFQSKLRQRDHQWQGKLDVARAELQAQAEQELRRGEIDAANTHARALREMEDRLRKELKERLEANHSETRQREQDLVAQLTVQTQAHQKAEKARDEAMQSASSFAIQVQDLEKKLTEASSFLAGWKNGKDVVGVRVGKDAVPVVREGSGDYREP